MLIQQVCVVYVLRSTATGSDVLLDRKLTGLGIGKVVAPGGKLEVGEHAAAAAQRELAEEVGQDLRWRVLQEVGVNRYRFPSKPAWHQDSHVFTAEWAGGSPTPSAELDPFWISTSDVPFEKMWSDARHWLPAVLQGGRVDADYSFAADLSSLNR